MKVTDYDTAHEADPSDTGVATCDPDEYGISWPYDATDLAYVYDPISGDSYAAGLWSLNDANRTVAMMQATGQQISFMDINGSSRWIPAPTTSEAAATECNWYSFSAINDVMESERTSDDPLYSGGVISIGDKTGAAFRWACTWWEFVERVRQEATNHPDVVKAILIDELNQIVDGPDTALHERWDVDDDLPTTDTYANEPETYQGAHWDYDNVEALADMTRGTYSGPDVDAFGNQETDTNICPAATSLAGSDIELWARVNDVAAPRHIVPAAVLGMPADPDFRYDPTGGGSPTHDYEFDGANGDRMSVSFGLNAPVLSATLIAAHPNWEADLTFLYTKAWDPGASQQIMMDIHVNGHTTTPKFHKPLDPTGGEEIKLLDECVGGPSCTLHYWDPTPGASNTVAISVAPLGATDLEQDRTTYLWALRVQYVDTTTGQVFWSTDSGTGGGLPTDTTQGSYAVSGSPGSSRLAEFNAPWRFDDLLDGVVLAHDVNASFNETAWTRFVEHACYHLHEQARDSDPVRCMIDERAQILDASKYAAFDVTQTAARMAIGRDYADGVLGTYLPMALENMSSDEGRFTERNTMDTGYEEMVYEPRLTRTMLGETHEYEAMVPAGCDGDYDFDVNVDKESDDPQFFWYVDHDDGSTTHRFLSDSVKNAATGGVVYSETEPVAAGDSLYAGWRSDGGGSSRSEANFVEFHSSYSGSGTGCELSWTRTNSIDPNYSDIEDVYDCIVNAFTDPTGFTCP